MVDLLIFSAAYCGPCKAMEAAGVYDAVKEAGFAIEKVDTQANPALADQFGVVAIPTMIIRKDQKAVGRLIGARTAESLIAEMRLAEAS